jgi:hypothetical protein
MHPHGPFCDGSHDPAGSPDPDADGASDPATLVGVRDGVLTVLYAPDGNSRAGAAGAGAADDGTSAPQSAAVGTSPFVINITWDSSVASAPAAFKTAVLAAAQSLESQFTDPATVNISVGYGEVDGTALGAGNLGASQSLLSSYGYGALASALSADAISPADKTAVASLPPTAPISGTFWATTAEAKALGLSTSTTSTDGYVGFSNALPWTYSNATGVAAGTYDFEAVALHELTEVMGRILLTGSTIGGFANSYSLMDLFHYQAAGVRDVSARTPGYFSADGGATSLGSFNTIAGGDAGDWALSVTNDSFDAFSSSGVVNAVTANDFSVMDAIGWNQASTGTSAATGMAVAAATGALNGDQTASGLGANAVLASVAQVGGASTDAYTYTLSGADASAFTLTTSANTAVVTVGGSALAGAPEGKLYSLTVTSTDKTDEQAGAAGMIGLVVASGAGDTVNVAALTQALGADTPTFVYGLGGDDILNGAGMTGRLFLAGGTGADIMTGGSGTNDYLFGSVADSTRNVLDIITNFDAGRDVIDLTGLGTKLSYAGQLPAGAGLGAQSIGWQQSGGDTVIYVDTTRGAQSLARASMEIKLTGLLAPTAANFAHV